MNSENKIKLVFDCDYFSDEYDDAMEEAHQKVIAEVIKEKGWSDVSNQIYDYMINHCKTPEAINNFCHLYYAYLLDEKEIANPYDFVGYILYIADLENNWDMCGDFIDSFTVSILESSKKLDLTQNPNYKIWEDTNVMKSIEILKNKK